jgi:cobalt-zinc-cadmium efflux system outer membrane protein
MLAAIATPTPTLARAQDARPPDAVTMTVSEALVRADEHAPDVAVAAAQAAVARRDVGVAGILPNPRIGGGVTVDYAGVLDLYVLLPIFGQLDTATDAARARARVADDAIEVARLDARLAVALAWTDLWLAEQNALLAHGDSERRGQLESAATARLDEGTVARIDVLRARADAARAAADASAAESARGGAAARLAGALGDDAPAVSIATSGDPLGASIDAAPLDLDAMLETHPLARRALASSRAAEEATRHDHRSRWPRLGVQLSDWIHRSNDSHDVRLMLTMDVPLFDEPRIERSEAAREQAHVEEAATITRLRSAALAMHADLVAVADRCRAQSETVVPAAREAADLAREGYREGSVDLTTTLAAAQALADAERSLSGCLADRARAAARLDHAEGRLDDWR